MGLFVLLSSYAVLTLGIYLIEAIKVIIAIAAIPMAIMIIVSAIRWMKKVL